MRLVIVGAGVAGLTSALCLGRRGVEPIVLERRPPDGEVGFGFLLMPNGVRALERLGLHHTVRDLGHPVHRLLVFGPRGLKDPILLDQSLGEDHIGLDRARLMAMLRRQALAAGAEIRDSWQAASVVRRSNGVAGIDAVESVAGERIEADMFVGADGIASMLRRELFPEARRRHLHIWELVSTSFDRRLAGAMQGRLVKFFDPQAGMALGMMPLSDREVIFYLQMDHRRYPLPPPGPDARKSFALEMLDGWAPIARRVVQSCTFERSHFYVTGDLDPLPTCHKGNVVLIGDAAHPFSPFTSQGVASALEDAERLSHYIAPVPGDTFDGRMWPDLGSACSAFHVERQPFWCRRLEDGRAQARLFLFPRAHEDIPPPLSE